MSESRSAKSCHGASGKSVDDLIYQFKNPDHLGEDNPPFLSIGMYEDQLDLRHLQINQAKELASDGVVQRG